MNLDGIGKKIKMQRLKNNMTQKDLANAMHVSFQLVSKWERGKSIPSLEYIDSLCKVFQCNTDFFINDFIVKSKKKCFLKPWKQISKKIKTIIVGIAALLFSAATCLLLYFVLIPAICKNSWINEMSSAIERNLDLGYYNILFSSYIDEENKSSYNLYGYLDENGNIAYSNPFKNEVVKNGILVKEIYKYNFENEQNITSLKNLFAQQLSSISENNLSGIDKNYIKYVNRNTHGFYIEFNNKFYDQLELDSVLSPTSKIKGWFEYQGKYFKSLTIEMQVNNSKANKSYNIKGVAEFIYQKQEISDDVFENKNWVITSAQVSPTIELIESFSNGNAEQMDNDYFSVLKDNNIFSSEDNELILLENNNLRFINNQDFSTTQIISRKKEYDSDYYYELDDSSYYAYIYVRKKEDNSLARQISYLTKYDLYNESVSVIGDYLYYMKRSESNSSKSILYKVSCIDHSNSYEIQIEIDNDFTSFKYINDYFIMEYGNRDVAISLSDFSTTESEIEINYIDMLGNFYIKENNTIKIWGEDIIPGTMIIAENNGIVFTGDQTNIYTLRNGVLIEQYSFLADNNIRENEKYNINLNEDHFQYLKNGEVTSHNLEPLLYIDDQIYSAPKIIDIYEDNILLAYYKYDQYCFVLYNNLNTINPYFTKNVKSYSSLRVGDKILIQFIDENNQIFSYVI